MQAILDGLVWAYAAFSVMPFASFALVWAIGYLITRDKKTSLIRAIDISTLFLIGSVSVLFNLVFHSSFGLYLLLLLFCLAFGLIGNLQYRKYGEIYPGKIFRIIWRLGFFGLGAAYLVLMTVGLTMHLIY